MGYYTVFRGEIEILPPLTLEEYTNSEWSSADWWTNNHDVKIVAEEGHTFIVPISDDDMKAYYILEDVDKLIQSLPNHSFDGYFECEGEEAGDLWRLAIRGRKAVKIVPEIVWPEEN